MVKVGKKVIHGWGINDVDYNVTEGVKENGKWRIVWRCPYYTCWAGMIERAKCLKFKSKHLTYKDCDITEDWKYLSNFIKWVDSQPNRDWVNCVPDKDLLIEGNKLYSTDTVVFVSAGVNGFILDSAAKRGNYLVGVSWHTKGNKFQAHCKNPLNPKSRKDYYLGLFATELEAHLAWKTKKHEYACTLASLQSDPRVIEALRNRYK